MKTQTILTLAIVTALQACMGPNSANQSASAARVAGAQMKDDQRDVCIDSREYDCSDVRTGYLDISMTNVTQMLCKYKGGDPEGASSELTALQNDVGNFDHATLGNAIPRLSILQNGTMYTTLFLEHDHNAEDGTIYFTAYDYERVTLSNGICK